MASAQPADACSCIEPGPPCETVWSADAVFVGRVMSTEPAFTAGMVPGLTAIVASEPPLD